MKSQKYLKGVVILALLGVLISSYATYQHYKPAGGSFCNVTEYVNCDIVNKSTYSEIFGVPVAVLGIFGYGTLALLAFSGRNSKNIAAKPKALMFLSGSALIFSLYLTFVELFVLYAICLLCVTSQLTIIFIFVLSLLIWKHFRAQHAHSL